MRGRPRKPEVQEAMRRCKELGLSYSGYLGRIRSGWTQEEALNMPRVGAIYKTKDGTPVYTYLKSIGKNYTVFLRYLYDGCTVEEALEMATKPRRNIKRYRDGIPLKQYCEQNGLNYVTEYYKEWRKK